MTLTETQAQISLICDDIKELLLYKNRKYGNSALEPIRVFSKADDVEQILVRIDDKLNRIQQGAGLIGDDEDVITDLIGYLVLLKLSLKKRADNGVWRIHQSLHTSAGHHRRYRSSKAFLSGRSGDPRPVGCWRHIW